MEVLNVVGTLSIVGGVLLLVYAVLGWLSYLAGTATVSGLAQTLAAMVLGFGCLIVGFGIKFYRHRDEIQESLADA